MGSGDYPRNIDYLIIIDKAYNVLGQQLSSAEDRSRVAQSPLLAVSCAAAADRRRHMKS